MLTFCSCEVFMIFLLVVVDKYVTYYFTRSIGNKEKEERLMKEWFQLLRMMLSEDRWNST